MIAQMSPEQLVTGGAIAGAVLLLKTAFDLYSQAVETKDRKVVRDNIVIQTEVLRNIHLQQTKQVEDAKEVSVSLSTVLERQLTNIPKLDRIDRNVIELKTVAGLPPETA